MSGWFRTTFHNPSAGIRLYCFPHAGGSAAFYKGWGDGLPSVEVRAVNYPGRAERIDEAAAQDVESLAVDLADAVVRDAEDRMIVMFGHSLGAVIALEVARSIERKDATVWHLFASGSRDGAVFVEAEPEDLDDDALAASLIRLGGTDAAMMADPFLRELVLPYVRADVRMYHRYRMSLEPRLRCPVTTIVGERDVDSDQRPWTSLTGSTFQQITVPGDHFYLVDNPPFELLNTALPSEVTREVRFEL